MADEEKYLELIEVAKATGKVKKGANEVTKALEKGIAKFVAIAGDVNPPEVVMHIPLLSKEKEVPFAKISTKEALGSAAGLPVGTSAVAIVELGDAKELLKSLATEPESKKDNKVESKEDNLGKKNEEEAEKSNTKGNDKKEEDASGEKK